MNILNCCRVCLEESAFNSFSFTEYIGNSTIKSLIQQICSNLDLDFKPNLICSDCLNELKIACSFKQKCENSEQFIKNINFETKFQIFDDFIDTNLFDEDYVTDYMNEDDLKPDFEELLECSSKSLPESVSSVDNKGIQVDCFSEKKITKKSSKRFSIKCMTCDDEFSGPSKLVIHARDFHNDTKPFKCSITGCMRAYQNPKALKVHKRSHEEDKRFKCSECNASFHVKGNLVSHARIHSGQKFDCEICQKSFSSLSYFKQHQISHNQEATGAIFICTFKDCVKKFSSQMALKSHLPVHSEKNFQCNICTNAFKTPQNLEAHLLKHSSGDWNRLDSGKICHICGFSTKYRQQYNEHVRSHNATRDFECFHCGKKFMKKTLLVLHMQTHLSERKFLCDIEDCKKAFKTYNSFYAHKRKHQSINSPRFNCASCDKVFSSHSVLMSHLKSHTGEKVWNCHYDGCTKAYAHKQNLNMHLLTAHVESDKTFKCDLCPRVLANSNQLRVHLNKIHKAEKNIKCPLCEMTFSSIQLLDVHKNIHQPKAHNCEFCNYSAKYKVDLERHLTKAHEDKNKQT
ncbi:hypothetical protein ACKWTF_004509 [Chironomus riparius]